MMHSLPLEEAMNYELCSLVVSVKVVERWLSQYDSNKTERQTDLLKGGGVFNWMSIAVIAFLLCNVFIVNMVTVHSTVTYKLRESITLSHFNGLTLNHHHEIPVQDDASITFGRRFSFIIPDVYVIIH